MCLSESVCRALHIFCPLFFFKCFKVVIKLTSSLCLCVLLDCPPIVLDLAWNQAVDLLLSVYFCLFIMLTVCWSLSSLEHNVFVLAWLQLTILNNQGWLLVTHRKLLNSSTKVGKCRDRVFLSVKRILHFAFTLLMTRITRNIKASVNEPII